MQHGDDGIHDDRHELQDWRGRRVLAALWSSFYAAATRNVFLKLLSFGLAVVLWAMVSEEPDVRQSYEVPLDLRSPPNLVLVSRVPQTVTVLLQGSRSLLKNLPHKELELTVDLEDARVGEALYEFRGQRIRNLPPGVSVVGYSPVSLSLEFDVRAERTLPVEVALESEVAEGYQVSGVTVLPSTLTVEGPQSILERLEKLRTTAVSLSGLRTNLKARYPIVLGDTHVRVREGQEKVLVTVQVTPVLIERRYTDLPVLAPETLGRYQLTPDHVEVVLEGPQELLETIKQTDIRIMIQEGSDTRSPSDVPLVLPYPPHEKGGTRPWLLISWPQEDKLRVKSMEPSSLELRLLGAEPESLGGSEPRGNSRGRRERSKTPGGSAR